MSASIEALLEAAKYVEQRVETPPHSSSTCNLSLTRLDGTAQNDAAQITKEAVQSSPAHPTPPGLARKEIPVPAEVSYQRTVPTDQKAERPRMVIEKPQFHFYRPLKGPTPDGKDILVTKEHGIYKVPEEARRGMVPSPGSHDTAAYTKLSNRPGLSPHLPTSQASSDPKLNQAGAEHVMRHPGYDVRWSYSAPEVRRPALPDKEEGAGENEGVERNAEEVTSDDGDDGRNRSGVRQVHNKLEKNRRAHLKECFDALQSQIPTLQDRKIKISNSNILSGACRYIGALKRKEKELEHELDWLVREKIRKQKLLHRLKMEKGKSLHVGMPWHQEGSVLTGNLLQQSVPGGKMKQERDDEDRYSTSTASEAEEEERKSQVETSRAVTTLVTLTTSITISQASFCTTVTSTSSDKTTSHIHPLKKYLLREHRAQEAMKAEAELPTALTAADTSTPTVTVVPSMPISPNTRPTVGQLLGKQTTPVRQPVRKQTPGQGIPAVLSPVGYPVQRYQVPVQGYIQQRVGQGELAVRPSQPVVTIGVTPTHQLKSEAKPDQSQSSPVISHMMKLPNGQLISAAPNPGHPVSIVSTPLPTAYLQTTFPGFPTAALTPQVMSPITIPAGPVKQVLLGNPGLTGYTTVPGLAQSLIGPFTSNTPTLVSPLLTNLTQTNTLTTIYANPLDGAQRTLGVSVEGALLTSSPVASTSVATKLSNSMVASHRLTTVPVLNPQALPHAVPKNRKATKLSKSALRNVLPARTKPPLTTSQIAKTCMAKGETVKAVGSTALPP